ncbi:MAG: phosphatidylglycerophosphatase A [Candidatus Marinimicrobia bacterium]|nr:phosphatidylglycerophosphatase A [Candidatus Neomarinimicrobiota bacterium]
MRTALVHLADWLSTCFRIGYLPYAPGTWGSSAAVIVWRLLPDMELFRLALIVIVIFLIGVISSTIVVEKEMESDPSHVIIDEWAGMWIALLMIPNEWVWIGIAFALFRMFDILKVYPADRFEKLPGGWGIMMDDVVAGLYAGITTQALVLFL